jgi:hypothetical protein
VTTNASESQGYFVGRKVVHPQSRDQTELETDTHPVGAEILAAANPLYSIRTVKRVWRFRAWLVDFWALLERKRHGSTPR